MMQLDDREMLDDILHDEKEIIRLYSTALAESTCAGMRQIMIKNIQLADRDEFDVFNKMRKLGYWQRKSVDRNEVELVKQQYGQLQQQL